jgi:hypothetical protein
MGKYTQNFKAKNSLSLYLAVTHSHLLWEKYIPYTKKGSE